MNKFEKMWKILKKECVKNKGPGDGRIEAVQEEIADVYIMLEQIRKQFMSDCELKELIEYKLDRECRRIEGRYHE